MIRQIQPLPFPDVENTDDGRDSYFAEAASIITDKERASIGMLQRYLKIGFQQGGPHNGSASKRPV